MITDKAKIARFLVVFLVLFFSTLHAPARLEAEASLDPDAVLAALNQDRDRHGLLPLEPNRDLEEAAFAKAEDILRNSYFAHTSPAGVKPWDFITSSGFRYSFAGENLAVGYDNAQELQSDFMDSPLHRKNLLSPLFSQVGIAVVEGRFQGRQAIITVEMFARPAEQVAIK